MKVKLNLKKILKLDEREEEMVISKFEEKGNKMKLVDLTEEDIKEMVQLGIDYENACREHASNLAYPPNPKEVICQRWKNVKIKGGIK